MRALYAAALAGGFVAVPAIADTPIQPGQWELRTIVTSVDMPGAPPQMLAMMKKPHVMRHCVTPEQAAKGPQQMLQEGKSDCRFTRYALAGGRLDAAMRCNSKERGVMTVTTKGRFTPANYDVTSAMVMSGPQGKMTMTSAGKGKRLGPCAK